MIEVTSNNFEELLPEIKLAISESTFIAIDTEFTGLFASNDLKSSLFDSCKDRYRKLRLSASKFVICQLGLATFQKGIDNNFIVKSFEFYLKPCTFGSIDKIFSFQTSSLEFLCDYNFDFNKFLKEGVTYLNEDEEKTVTNELKSKPFLMSLDRGEVDNHYLQDLCSQVSQWLPRAKENDILVIESLSKIDKTVDNYIALNELRKKFRTIWPKFKEHSRNIIVEKVSAERRTILEKETLFEDTQMLNTFLGFSQVFKELVAAKKPLIGHNLMTDLVLIHQNFYRPLPRSFSQFKNSIHKLFPQIYDTKHILSYIQLSQNGINLKPLRSLEDMYTFFAQRKSFKVPKVIFDGNFKEEISVLPHHAGFDAFACGYCLLRLACINGSNNLTKSEVHILTWPELVSALKPFENKINLIRASIHYLDLMQKDPKTIRPQWLLLRTKQGKSLDISQTTESFSRYGVVDVRPVSRTSALVAAGNITCVRDIQQAFCNDERFSIVLYNPIKHSKIGQISLCATCVALVSLSTFCIWKLLT